MSELQNKFKTYQDWVDNYEGCIHRKCVEVAKEMAQTFPELKIRTGLVKVFESARLFEHTWCITDDGYIVDPTAQQWTIIEQYYDYTDNPPIGKCINCGNYIFADDNPPSTQLCSEACRESFLH
jgi:hypothetical protein